MQHHFLNLFVIITIVSQTTAQDLSNLPTCAQGPAISSISSTGCSLTDFACICKDSSFINSLTPAIQKDCSAADIQKVIVFSDQLCDSVGVTLSQTASNSAAPSTIVPSTAAISAGISASTTATAATSTPTTSVHLSGSPTTTPSSSASAKAGTTTSNGAHSTALNRRLMHVVLSLGVMIITWLSGL